ncbi:hypothetical protein [Streptomyces cuspidosporus]|uniref:NADH:flavin oxidoreductase/NADH oxidase N-terminal domain-containing protein n=1 Tax=Streptomyces cuspidosporus TaxID=66882 RepID=A0ABP5SAW1_9ACTN
MSRNDPVLQPLRVNNLLLRNRIYSTGHAPSGYLDGGAPGPRYALYHEEKAKGGIALTIIGGSSNVAPDSANVFDQIDAGDDAVLPFYRSISERVHEHGAAIMLQVTHLGRRSKWDIDRWLPAVGPSAVRERAHRSFPNQGRLVKPRGDRSGRPDRGPAADHGGPPGRRLPAVPHRRRGRPPQHTRRDPRRPAAVHGAVTGALPDKPPCAHRQPGRRGPA